MSNVCTEVKATFLILQEQIALLEIACQDETERGKLNDKYEAARKLHDKCIDKMLHADEKQLQSLIEGVETANEQLKKSVQEMGNMSKVIDAITDALTFSEKLIKLIS